MFRLGQFSSAILNQNTSDTPLDLLCGKLVSAEGIPNKLFNGIQNNEPITEPVTSEYDRNIEVLRHVR